MRFDAHLREAAERDRRGAAPLHTETEVPAAPARFAERIEAAVDVAELGDRPTYILAAAPLELTTIQGLVESDNSAVVQLIKRPPEVRPHGFDISAGREARLVEGQLRRVSGMSNRCLDVWRDGTVVFVGAGDDDFLCWGRPSNKIRINPLVLAESTLLFATLVSRIHELNGRAVAVEFILQLRHVQKPDQTIVMAPYHLDAVGAHLPHHQRGRRRPVDAAVVPPA